MKILSSVQIREADNFTIKNEPISSIDLMERASFAFVEAVFPLLKNCKKILVFCGPGNNGGDGLAISRLLFNAGFLVETYYLVAEKYATDFEINLQKLQDLPVIKLCKIQNFEDFPIINIANEIVIDALFGTGLTRPLKDLPAILVSFLNNCGAKIISVDVPSGLFTDVQNNVDDSIIKAENTFTFAFAKPAFLICQNAEYVGNWQVLNIGIHAKFSDEIKTNKFRLNGHF